MFKACPICSKEKNHFNLERSYKIWENKWTKKPEQIFWCHSCDLRFTKNFRKNLQDNKIFRKLYDGSNSIRKYLSFNKKREKSLN